VNSTKNSNQERHKLLGLILGTIGIVYGDIGTSPLYTMKEVFSGSHSVPLLPDNILGVLSLVFWALIIVVSIKYVVFIMRADNQGEGGIMAMLALVQRATIDAPRTRFLLTILGIFGAALFYGDGMITPAISVLSAVEGLKVAAPSLDTMIVPLSLVILVGLFTLQSKGTASVGTLFGPIMVLWFTTLALLGIISVIQSPKVLQALNPFYALNFFMINKIDGFLALGAVVLAVTGAEALYADMGHFGKHPIRLSWFLLVLPALLLNYFGQGALLLRDPQSIQNPFYLLAPAWAIYPMIFLATAATIIASQAVISGAFSVTRQAIQLGYLPRMEIRHTSSQEIGQIYIPFINWSLLLGIIILVLGFQSSSQLASAYGIAVTGTMVIDTILGFVVVQKLWRWNPLLITGGLVVFLTVDLAFFSANSFKIIHGGWFPLVIGLIVFTLLATWKKGRNLLRERLQAEAIVLEPFLASLDSDFLVRVPGTAVFLNAHTDTVPHALLHNLAHNKVLHERVIFLTVVIDEIPYVAVQNRIEMNNLDKDFFRIIIHYGFKEEPSIPKALSLWSTYHHHPFNMLETSFFLNRETLVPTSLEKMPLWQKKLFVWMSRNAQSAMRFFRIPTNRVIELGSQVEL
jgi:KUP system potassium uptake protein